MRNAIARILVHKICDQTCKNNSPMYLLIVADKEKSISVKEKYDKVISVKSLMGSTLLDHSRYTDGIVTVNDRDYKYSILNIYDKSAMCLYQHPLELDLTEDTNIIVSVYYRLCGCQIHNHVINFVRAFVNTVTGLRVIITVQYCVECDKYFMDRTSLSDYERRYHCLLFNRDYIGDNESSKYSDEYNRSERSKLNILGYNTSLNEYERQNVIKWILLKQLMTKNEIVNHLTLLIETNGRFQDRACSIWEEDLLFTREYGVDPDKTIKVVLNR